MKIFKFKLVLLLIAFGFALAQVGCVKENFDVTPVLRDSSKLVATDTIAGVKTLLTAELPFQFKFDRFSPITSIRNFWDSLYHRTGDTTLIIEGYVTSNDSAGNFYEVFTIQDQTGGIDIKVNAARLYTIYGLKPGQRVLVKLNNLYGSYYKGTYQIGSTIVDEGALKLVGMDINQLSKYVERSGVKKPVEPIELSISELQNSNFAYVQKLVRIKDVQFWDITKTWALPTLNTNRMVMDSLSKSLIIRTSGFAFFSQNIVPGGNGTITGVLGRYNNDLQLMVRDESDAKLTNLRYGGGIPVPNTTVKQLKAMCPVPISSQTLAEITSDVVVEAVIVANDKSGNLFKQLFLEDETGGIEFKVDMASLYIDFPVGTKLVINCKGMYLGTYGNSVQLGGIYNGSIGRLSAADFYQKVSITGSSVVNPISVTIGTLHDSLIGRLVKFPEVQFIQSENGLAWAPGAVTNRNIEDFWGARALVRTSNFASFANAVLPSGSGEFTAILSKYFNDYQMYVRTIEDVIFVNPRFSKEILIDETFSNATVGQPISVGGWQTKMIVGTKQWIAKDVTSNRCAEMSAVNVIGETANTAWLISPQVNLSSISPRYLSFKTQYANWKDEVSLELFVSSNYDGADPTLASWTKVNDAYIVKSTDAAAVWVNSSIVSLDQYTGNVHFGFKYVRNGGLQHQATTFRVDDFQVFGKK